MSTLIPAMVATAILGVATVPIANLSLETAKNRVDSELLAEAELLALGVRRDVAQADSLTAEADGTLTLATNGSYSTYVLPSVCIASTAGSDEVHSVTCTASRGKRENKNSQSLFTTEKIQDAMGGGSQGITSDTDISPAIYNDMGTNRKRKDAVHGTIDFLNKYYIDAKDRPMAEILPSSDAACALLAENPAQPAQPMPENPAQPAQPKECDATDYKKEKYETNPEGTTWNSHGGIIKSEK